MQADSRAPLELFQRRVIGVQRIAWSASDIRRIAEHFGLIERDIQGALSSSTLTTREQSVARGAVDNGYDHIFTISTKTKDRMNDTVEPTGWNLDEFRRNPVVQFAHNGDALPIGRSPSVWLSGGKLKASLKLAPADANPLAGNVRQLIDGGFLSACSVGFIPDVWRFSKDPARPYGVDFLAQTLIEWSVCNVGACPDALIDPKPANSKSIAARKRERDLDLIRMRGVQP
jgi:phage head maturation protease